MASTNVMERVESALKNNNDKSLRQIYRDLSLRIQSCAFLSDRELLAQMGKPCTGILVRRHTFLCMLKLERSLVLL